MVSTEIERLGSIQRTAAQTRILVAALDLFADHGVSGTSLQMIADAIGVTKAAVYHQFKTKDEIIIAVAEMQRSAGWRRRWRTRRPPTTGRRQGNCC